MLTKNIWIEVEGELYSYRLKPKNEKSIQEKLDSTVGNNKRNSNARAFV